MSMFFENPLTNFTEHLISNLQITEVGRIRL